MLLLALVQLSYIAIVRAPFTLPPTSSSIKGHLQLGHALTKCLHSGPRSQHLKKGPLTRQRMVDIYHSYVRVGGIGGRTEKLVN